MEREREIGPRAPSGNACLAGSYRKKPELFSLTETQKFDVYI